MRYTKEEKLEIIRLVESSDLPLKRTVKELNVSTSTFYSWYNKFLEGGPDALEDKKCRSTWNKIPESYRTKVIEVALDRSGDSPGERGARTFSCKPLKINNQQRLFPSGVTIWILLLRQRASPEDAPNCQPM